MYVPIRNKRTLLHKSYAKYLVFQGGKEHFTDMIDAVKFFLV